jgi:hypothetical protein
MKITSIHHEGQKFTYTDKTLVFPSFATALLEREIDRWQGIFPKENTLIAAKCNVPSLFLRIDCVISPDSRVHIFEIQEGCAWIGYSGIVNESYRVIRDAVVKKDWGTIKVLRWDNSDQDDDLWVPRVSFSEALNGLGPLFVRTMMPKAKLGARDRIIRRSLQPVMTHNDKQYGVEMGLWKDVSWTGTKGGELLPWNSGFVLKPYYGNGSKDVMIWATVGRRGRATKTQILNAFKKYSSMLLQELALPVQVMIDRHQYNTIYRPYFIYSMTHRKYIPIHGVWTARPYPNLRIHGASDAVSGPLMMDTAA